MKVESPAFVAEVQLTTSALRTRLELIVPRCACLVVCFDCAAFNCSMAILVEKMLCDLVARNLEVRVIV